MWISLGNIEISCDSTATAWNSLLWRKFYRKSCPILYSTAAGNFNVYPVIYIIICYIEVLLHWQFMPSKDLINIAHVNLLLRYMCLVQLCKQSFIYICGRFVLLLIPPHCINEQLITLLMLVSVSIPCESG